MPGCNPSRELWNKHTTPLYVHAELAKFLINDISAPAYVQTSIILIAGHIYFDSREGLMSLCITLLHMAHPGTIQIIGEIVLPVY